jgi:enediyne polyketide synthase
MSDEHNGIAVIGIGCWYPGASSPKELWENILSRRREFREFPDIRLPLKDYHDPNPETPDKTYGTRGAFVDGFSFDLQKRKVPKSTFNSTDISHWLALEVAIQALENSPYKGTNLPNARTGVIVGNTLTGEQTRSSSMRLRWPFIEKTLRAASEASGLDENLSSILAENMEAYYKSVFAPITEDTLAGGLSNTIAGRIANSLNLLGGAYTVDGACSSSLIAITTAANAIQSGQMDMALAGGVDISLDSFELIGFAKKVRLHQLICLSMTKVEMVFCLEKVVDLFS